jgi:hypothetical protein
MDYANVVSMCVARYSKRGVRTVRYPPLTLLQKEVSPELTQHR